MENIKNHPAPDQLDSFDKYPPYYGQDLELAYTPQRSVFTPVSYTHLTLPTICSV